LLDAAVPRPGRTKARRGVHGRNSSRRAVRSIHASF
jgi:hypothetical protein